MSYSSDRRLKKDIVDSGSALPYFNDMRIRDFTMIGSGERITGVIAQELENTHPELVNQVGDGYLSVAYPNPWKMAKAIQELQAEIESLKHH